MFDQTTLSARRAIVLAQDVARNRGADEVRNEHLLTALLEIPECTAAVVLRSLDLAGKSAGDGSRHECGHPDGAPAHPVPFSTGTKQTLVAALQFAVKRHDDYVGTEHILLALLDDDQGRALPEAARPLVRDALLPPKSRSAMRTASSRLLRRS